MRLGDEERGGGIDIHGEMAVLTASCEIKPKDRVLVIDNFTRQNELELRCNFPSL